MFMRCETVGPNLIIIIFRHGIVAHCFPTVITNPRAEDLDWMLADFERPLIKRIQIDIDRIEKEDM